MIEPIAISPPSSDLTFLTNEEGKTLRDRFVTLLSKDTRFFDCLVGYFFISGFYVSFRQSCANENTVAGESDWTLRHRLRVAAFTEGSSG